MTDPGTPATPPTRRGDDPPPPPRGGFWTFVGAFLLARREGDAKHQRAMRNVRWLLGSGFAAYFAILMFQWVTAYVERVQRAAEVRDAALVTTLAEVTEQLERLTSETNGLSVEIASMRSLAIGSGKLPDCPACVCPACPPVIVTGAERRSPAARPAPPPPRPPAPPPAAPSRPRDMRPGKEP